MKVRASSPRLLLRRRDDVFCLCANTDPQRASLPKPRHRQDRIFTKGPADVLDHATSEIAIGSKLGIDGTKKLPGEGLKRPWPSLIKMDAGANANVRYGNSRDNPPVRS